MKKVRPWVRMKNLPSLYSRAHGGFCKRCCQRSFSFKASDCLAKAIQCASVLRSMCLKNGFRYFLLNLLLQPLGSTTHVPTIAVAQKLINNVDLM